MSPSSTAERASDGETDCDLCGRGEAPRRAGDCERRLGEAGERNERGMRVRVTVRVGVRVGGTYLRRPHLA